MRSKFRALSALTITGLLTLSVAPALGQSDPLPNELPDPPQLDLDELRVGPGSPDLWVHQGDALTRVDARNGEVLGRRDVAGTGCSFGDTWPRAVRPDNGALVLRGMTGDPDPMHCFVRVPVNGGPPNAYVLAAPEGRAYHFDERTSVAMSGEDLVLVAAETEASRNTFGEADQDLLRLAPDGSIESIRRHAFAVAPSPAGPFTLYLTRPGKKGKFRTAILDAASGELVSDGVPQAKLLYPPLMHDNGAGLVAYWGKWDPKGGVMVFDMRTGKKLGKAKPPKNTDFVVRAYPATVGVWLEVHTKKGKNVTAFVPFEGKPTTVKPCAGLGKDCVAGLFGQTGDSVWFMAGTYDGDLGAIDPMAATFRKFTDPRSGHDMELVGAEFLLPVEV